MPSPNAASLAHALRHASGGPDQLTPNAIGAATDLTDVMVSAASATLTANQNNNVTTAAGTFTAPAPAATVGTPPQRFALTNLSTGNVTLSFPNQAGTTVNLTIFPGEVVTFRQKSINGYSAESGNKPLSMFDGRYLPILTSAPTAWTANTAYVKGQTVTQGGYFQTAIASFTSGATFSQANWVQGAPTVAGGASAAQPLPAVPPANAVAEAFPRFVAAVGTVTATSGQLRMTAVQLTAGQVINSLSFMSGTTAGATFTHQWFAVLDTTGKVLGVTADDTSTAWAASSLKTLALTSPLTIPTTGVYYIGRMVTASTMPTTFGVVIGALLSALAPVYVTTVAGQTTPPATGSTLTFAAAGGNVDYGYAA